MEEDNLFRNPKETCETMLRVFVTIQMVLWAMAVPFCLAVASIPLMNREEKEWKGWKLNDNRDGIEMGWQRVDLLLFRVNFPLKRWD